jgi:hypothetical protein
MVDRRRRSMVLASYRFFVDVGALLGPLGLAWVYGRFGSSAAIDTAGVILLVASGVALLGARRISARLPVSVAQ